MKASQLKRKQLFFEGGIAYGPDLTQTYYVTKDSLEFILLTISLKYSLISMCQNTLIVLFFCGTRDYTQDFMHSGVALHSLCYILDPQRNSLQ